MRGRRIESTEVAMKAEGRIHARGGPKYMRIESQTKVHENRITERLRDEAVENEDRREQGVVVAVCRSSLPIFLAL